MAANIVPVDFDLLRRSFDGLMDHALNHAETDRIRTAVESILAPVMRYYALRTRRAGGQRFVDYHLLVPGRTSVAEAHGG